MSETHVTKEINETEIHLNGYNHYNCLSNSARTGGVVVYFKLKWKVRKVAERIVDTKIWITAYLAQNQCNKYIVVAIYRSPSSVEHEFIEVFADIAEEISELNCDIIIAGDINIDWCKHSFYRNKFKSILDDNGLKQVIDEFTRITQNSRTLIDYVITNTRNISAKVNISNKISDHEAIDIMIDCGRNVKNKETFKQIELFKYNKGQFKRETREILRVNSENDINHKVILLDKNMENAVKKLTKKKTIRENSECRWFNDEIRRMKREKINKYQIAMYENTGEAWSNYRAFRNIYKVKLQNEKKKYINNKITLANDQKEMWRQIKNLILKKRSESTIETVIFNTIEYTNKYEIAENFNKYFVTSIESIRSAINNVQYIPNLPVINHQFKFRAISIEDLKSICKTLKNKPDFNKISSKMILDNLDTIGKVMLDIINTSFRTGIFPENWKTSMITPIEKISKTKKCEEFRPINALQTCEKLMEKVVKEQLEQYMESYGLLSKYQSGYRKKFSCETAVNYVINKWKKVEKNKSVVGIFLDFKRAFETIDRNILLQKLFHYGIRDTELQWFQSYLTGRKQITKVNNIKSSPIFNEYGVPQGSILGALLFIIYINDMPNLLERCQIILYADDTLIFAEGESDRQCYDDLTHDIKNINRWLDMNKLKLNESKTKILEINTTSNVIFKINDQVIEKVGEIKYLGMIIDKEIKFKTHIDYICKKIGKKISFFKRIRKHITLATAINVYNTMIKPHFEFGSTIVYSCCTVQQVERLQKLQNRAMRTILKCNRYTSINFMLSALKWLNIRQRITLNTLDFIQKIKTGQAPEYLTEQISYVGEVQPYQLRNINNFRIERVTTTAMQRSLFYKGLQLYNGLPTHVKDERNPHQFRRNITNFVKYNVF